MNAPFRSRYGKRLFLGKGLDLLRPNLNDQNGILVRLAFMQQIAAQTQTLVVDFGKIVQTHQLSEILLGRHFFRRAVESERIGRLASGKDLAAEKCGGKCDQFQYGLHVILLLMATRGMSAWIAESPHYHDEVPMPSSGKHEEIARK
ncbi:MAG: hypothetical protein ACREO2_04025 [Arenimonas sp.]